nr:reverse transcriptase domain-containing protein [Tanacetum cinerariifolium]
MLRLYYQHEELIILRKHQSKPARSLKRIFWELVELGDRTKISLGKALINSQKITQDEKFAGVSKIFWHENESIREANVEIQILEDVEKFLHLVISLFAKLLVIKSRRIWNDGFGLGFRALTGASTGLTTGATTGSEFGGTVSFLTLVSRSTTLRGKEVVGIVGPLYAIPLQNSLANDQTKRWHDVSRSEERDIDEEVIGDPIHFDNLGDVQTFVKMLVSIGTWKELVYPDHSNSVGTTPPSVGCRERVNHLPPEEMNTASSSGFRTLLSNTITNPKEYLKGITTRSGIAYKGPTIPTTSSPPKVVESETEVTKDTVPLTNNGSTKDVQPLVVQVETSIPNSEPIVAPVVEPVEAPVSAPKPNPKPSIPYPSRLHKQKLRDKANDQKEKIFQIFQDLNFNISFTDVLILMPKFGLTIKSLLTNKDKLFELARTPLHEHFLAVLLKKLPEKLGDPDKFLIPFDFLGMDECLSLANLSASINLMPLSV